MRHPGRIVLGAIAASFALAAFGGASAVLNDQSIKSFLADHYGVEGRGTLDNGCGAVSSSGFPESCFDGPVGILLGDSHASVLFGSFAKSFETLGQRLVLISGPGCEPLLFAPRPRRENRAHKCAAGIAPFERLLARPTPVSFVIISANWGYFDQLPSVLSDLISQFDSERTRILLIGPVPIFLRSGLECVVLSHRQGVSRDRCARPRRDVEAKLSKVIAVLKAMPARFGNVRYIDPLEVFCDDRTCRPFDNDSIFYSDTHHVLPRGAELIYDTFNDDFLWLAGKR
jgi:hypothetical protein